MLVFAGIGAIASWSFGNQDIAPYSVAIVGTISALASIFCIWWWRQIISYKQLNGAKFVVLDQMAKKLLLNTIDSQICCSFEPFRKEWEIMKNNDALKSGKWGFAMSATIPEIVVPIAF